VWRDMKGIGVYVRHTSVCRCADGADGADGAEHTESACDVKAVLPDMKPQRS
jgi:hypothetical protein